MKPRSSFTGGHALGVPLVVLLLAFGPGCGSDDEESAGSPTYSPDFSAVDAKVAEFMTATMGVKGITYVVVEKDHGVVHTNSVGNLTGDKVEIMTSSGMMVATMVLLSLVDEGLIELDKPVAQYISWGTLHPDITLEQLLSNTSGLPGLSSAGFNYPPYACEFQADTTLSECAKSIFNADLSAKLQPPGSVFLWGGGGWQVMGGIAEDLTGHPWKQLVEERLRTPCGLTSLTFAQPPFDPTQFNGDPATLLGQDNPSIELGAVASADDYAKILLAHLRGGACDANTVLSSAMVEEMRVDRSSAVGGDPYGMGWFIHAPTEPGGSPSIYLAQGLFGTTAWIDASRNYGVFIGLQSQAQDGTNLSEMVRPLIETALESAASVK